MPLVTRLSQVLARRGVAHETVSAGAWHSHVALLPEVEDTSVCPLAELEHHGMPVAASAIPSHIETRLRASLFDPASPHAAADAVLSAAEGATSRALVASWRAPTVAAYAESVSSEITRLLLGGAP